MLHRLCGPPSIPLSFTLAGRGLPGSLILFAPHAFVPQRQYKASKLPSLLVFLMPPTHPLNPINPDNACTLRITAAAGTELAGAYSYGPSSCTRHGWFRLAPIDQYSLLLPPVGVWPVSQCQCGGLSSQNPYPSSPW
eukprot:gene1028-1304_t